MIRRTEDYSLFSNKELSKIANVIKQVESKKLYDTFKTADEARVTKKTLKVQGYDSEVFQVGSNWEVHVVMSEQVALKEAEQSGLFKKLAFGRYTFHKESSLSMHDYPFDDGSIWRVVADNDGNPVLVKEVADEENENSEVLRVKQASLQKSAALIDQTNYQNALKILFTITSLNPVGDQFIQSLFEGLYKNDIINDMNEKLESYIDQYISDAGLTSENVVGEIKEIIYSGLISNQFATLKDVELLIDSYDQINEAEESAENLESQV